MKEGFKIRKRGECTICLDCAEKLSMKRKLEKEASQKGSISNLDSKNYASEVCLVCKENIGRRGNTNLDLPEQIATLLDKKFENVGGRFGGVNPVVDTESSRKQIKDGVVKGESIRTKYDPVIVELRPDEQDIYKKVVKFLKKLSNISNVQYKTSEIKNENDEIAIYEIMVFTLS